MAVRIVVSGKVQGVGFRFYTKGAADEYGVGGFVRNAPDGSVEVEAAGPQSLLEQFVLHIRRGPATGTVASCDIAWQTGADGAMYEGFSIRP